jgi:hypothetical protein
MIDHMCKRAGRTCSPEERAIAWKIKKL